MKTAVLVATLALACAAPAEAATVKQVTSTCHDGGFSGRFTLRFETSGGYHRPLGAITTAGPYIGDSGTQSLRISYQAGTSTHTVYTHVGPATNGEHTETFPAGLTIPVTARGSAAMTFDSGTASCVATVPIG
ncbi:hypothetical protein M8542_14175 [Amycolatopsis sp. OK19-0408]|uniref:Secreted protein n=1 Tax=Amycolatopsis iheyensis TaxID=2945988 RepID=A0A9X2SJE9_9PSEU|nr:hypothetical protein [Amycolatopsis iheyensis]MCR6483968.1 hypothetical protein [Amycolatopsis iheyensis]